MTGQCALLTAEVVIEPCRPGCKHYMYCLSSKLVGGDLRLLRQDVHRHRQVPQGERLAHAGQACQGVYVIRSGWFKQIFSDEQGSEQIVGFRGPGELIGLVDLMSGTFSNDVVALQDAEVWLIPAARAMAKLGHDAQSEAMTAMAWRVEQERKRLWGRDKQNAQGRVATFFLDLWDNQQLQPVSEASLRLPMSRADIANFLGMKIETLSRCISTLQQEALISAKGRTIGILNVDALRKSGSQ